jgi:CheY-like chemotaxis protein
VTGGEPALKVLIADDEPVNRLFLKYALRRHGCEHEEAASGVEVLELIRGQAFDLVLLDCEMPELDGYATTREIRRAEASGERDGHLPIVAMTGHAEPGARERHLAAGMDDYICKPIGPHDLGELLTAWRARIRGGERT